MRGDSSDEGALGWAAEHADRDDDLHVFYAYRELALAGSTWSPAVDAVMTARQRLRAPCQHVEASVVAQHRIDLLADLATIADLLVLGVPATMPVAFAMEEARRVVSFNPFAERSCAVALIPEQSSAPCGVVVLLDSAGQLEGRAVTLAVAAAAQLHTSIRAIRPYVAGRDAKPSDTELIATERAQSEQLAMELSEAAGIGGPALVGEVAREPLTDALRRLRGHVALVIDVVLQRDDRSIEPSSSAYDCALVALGELAVPLVVVPARS